MKGFRIGNIEIGKAKTPLIIPEIGINHGGDINVAKEMVFAAYKAGAQIVKHQTHVCDDEMTYEARYVIPGNSTQSIYDIMKSCALSYEEEKELKLYTENLGMTFLSTPFSRAAADRLEMLGVEAYKIGSGEMNNYPLLEYVASFGKPMIVSTGMNSIATIKKTVDILIKKNIPFALLHTTNLYPTLPSQVRLGAMQQMMNAFKEVPIGLSDHSLNNNACIAAMTLGATVIERHFTDSKKRTGPDIACSMDPTDLAEIILASKEIPQMLDGEKKPLPEEKITMDFAFASVVSISSITKGDRFTPENIWVKRPGLGIPAEQYSSILGKIAACDIDMDKLLKPEMIMDYE